MSSSNQVKMLVENMNPQRLRTFLLIAIDKVHKPKTSFYCSLLQAYIDSHDDVVNKLNFDLADDILLLCNNMNDLPKLEE